MPGFDQLENIPQERREALLRKMRALQTGEGLAVPGDVEAGPAGAVPSQAAQSALGRPHRGPRPRHRPRIRCGLAMVAGAVALAVGGAALLDRPAGPDAHRVTAPRSPSPGVSPGEATPPTPEVSRRAAATAPASPVPAATQAASPAAPVTEIVGVGCPDGLGQDVTLDTASTEPGWLLAGGGWAGNGCDGTSAWTWGTPGPAAFLPGLVIASPTLTWNFHPQTGTSRCTVAVYMPTSHALGEGQYTVFSPSGILGAVLVDQAATAGQWITLGTYQVTGPLAIQLSPQSGMLSGLDAASGSPVAASATRATCS